MEVTGTMSRQKWRTGRMLAAAVERARSEINRACRYMRAQATVAAGEKHAEVVQRAGAVQGGAREVRAANEGPTVRLSCGVRQQL